MIVVDVSTSDSSVLGAVTTGVVALREDKKVSVIHRLKVPSWLEEGLSHK